jgi:hypothetical protein
MHTHTHTCTHIHTHVHTHTHTHIVVTCCEQVPQDDPLLRSHYLSDTRAIVSGNTGIK